jgi:MerR family transcriptional regulator, light-induced transcriptional regulator
MCEQMDRRQENDSQRPDEARIARLAVAFADALTTGDEIAADIAVSEAMDAGLSTAEIDERLIAPGMWLVGELWQRGEISVAEEHIATEITTRVIALQREARRVVASRRGRRVLLATPAGERHAVALHMVSNLLHDAGYDIVMVGPDVPAAALGASARLHRADVVCLSSSMTGRFGQMLEAIDAVRREWPAAPFVIGGRGLTCESESRPEVRQCRGVSDAVDAVDAMIMRAGRN